MEDLNLLMSPYSVEMQLTLQFHKIKNLFSFFFSKFLVLLIKISEIEKVR